MMIVDLYLLSPISMILRDALKRCLLVQWKGRAGYIHIEDHQKKINPKRQQLSYNNPNLFKKEKAWVDVPMGRKAKKNLEQARFREYKEKMLNPKSDPVIEPNTADLWYGLEEEEPKHYFSDLPTSTYFKVPSIRRAKNFYCAPELVQPNEALTTSVDL